MNIKDIYKRSNSIYLKNRKIAIPEFFYVGYISLLAHYLQSGLFSFFVSIFLSPIAQGYVRCAMKYVNDEDAKIFYKDPMIGIIDFTRVAPIYFVKKILYLLITLVIWAPAIHFNLIGKYFELSMDTLSRIGDTFIQTEFYIPNLTSLEFFVSKPLILVLLIINVLIFLFINALFFSVPYIIEEKDYSWLESIHISYQITKGHMLAIYQLYFAYFLRILFYWVVAFMMMNFIGYRNELLLLLSMVLSLLLYIDLFKGRFEIAKYLFYLEIRRDDDEGFVRYS